MLCEGVCVCVCVGVFESGCMFVCLFVFVSKKALTKSCVRCCISDTYSVDSSPDIERRVVRYSSGNRSTDNQLRVGAGTERTATDNYLIFNLLSRESAYRMVQV